MTEPRTVRPAKDRRVRHGHAGKHRLLKADGEPVTWSSFWERRLRDGDVVEVTQKKPQAAAPAPASQTKSES
jgi:hypothetical protein